MTNLKIGEDIVLDKNGAIQSYPVGTIIAVVSSTIPDGWLLCDGTTVNYSDYPKLGTHLGYSSGTFTLPALVYNATNNPTVRIPVSTISSEPTYPNVFGHSHVGTTTLGAMNSYGYFHIHNTNTLGSNADTHYHSHGVSGNTNTSSNAGGSEPGRAAGPNGPYASGPSGGTGHSHGGAGWSANTDAGGSYHSHTVNLHSSNLIHSHNHTVSGGNALSSTSSIYPLSVEVNFLIKH